MGKPLRWPDAAAGLALATVGTLAAGAAPGMRWLPGIVAAFAAHVWLAIVALAWYLWLGRRFPVGSLARRELLPWSVLWLLAVVGNLLQAFSSPPNVVRLPAPAMLAAELLLLALVVGPSEELIFRGLIQTGINGSLHSQVRVLGWPLRLGTLLAAVGFGLWHLVNLTYQGLGPTLEQVLVATLIGLVIGVVYDRTRNLIGAAILHSLLDLTGTVMPWVAYWVVHR
ncbi:MAG TPA: type II CAAX endopeptidase family protein [Candidatus Dormibacteraeota bacterium]|nr:type II CAAX endopeptidase family protein [Candidatus Dormibacteraeota bacterium]